MSNEQASHQPSISVLRRGLPLLIAGILLLISIAGTIWFDHPSTASELAAPIAESLEDELAASEKEAVSLIAHPDDQNLWVTTNYSFFLIDSGRIKNWSKNDFIPDWRSSSPEAIVQLVQTSTSDYLLRRWRLSVSSQLILVVPLRKDYDIINDYLSPEWNTKIFTAPVFITDVGLRQGASVCTKRFGCIFSVQAAGENVPSVWTWLIFIGYSASFFILILFVVKWLGRLHRQGAFQKTFLWMGIFLIAFRIILVEFNFPNAIIKFRLFDPKHFASSSFNASIGDLLLNSIVILILCIYLFNFYSHFKAVRNVLRASSQKQALAAVVCLVVSFFALLFPFLYCEVIYHNSSISLEITDSLSFDAVRTAAFVSLLIGSVCSFLIIHISLRLALVLRRFTRRSFLLMLGIAAILFVGYFLLAGRSYWITLGVGLLLFPSLYYLRLALPVARLTFRSFLYFLIVVIAFAVQGMLGVSKFQEEEKTEALFRYGNNFLVDQDVLGEYLLNESTRRIEKDPYIQLRLASPFLSKASVRQKIKLFYLSSYFDRYDVQVYLYNFKGEPYENIYGIDFENAIRRYQKDAFKTIYPGIYYINNPSEDATKKYLVIIPVRRFGAVLGYAVLDLTLKKVIPQNVYPELLVDHRFSQYVGNPEISYAWYSQGKLKGSFGNFNYSRNFDPTLLQNRSLFQLGIRQDSYYHVALEEKAGNVVVVTGQRYPAFFMITNFAFFFTLGLGVILGYLFVTGALSLLRGRQLNYSAKIQLYVYLAFFFPLLAVSATTLSLISRSNKEKLIKDYGAKATMLSQRIAGSLQQFAFGNGETQNDFQNKLIELAKLSSTDASVYSIYGGLIASSQPAIFENHLESHLISRQAWNQIVLSGENLLIADEEIGKLNYNCSYAAIKSPETGRLIGILSVPFFTSASSLEKAQINVLSNILTVFVIILILFSFLSFFVTKELTFPLRFITQSLKRTSLTETNQRISWDSKDEIGLLATEYNRMVQNLEQSRAELVRSQKESAWREIAKQVAHEIKNPLTPMKLTLQQWENNLTSGDVSPERARRSIGILLAQLETLNEIAGSFSAFARMPSPVLEKIDLVPLLKQVVQLHASLKEGDVVFNSAEQDVFVMGDDQLLGRIFSNLVLNALQSGNEGQRVEVDVRLSIGVGNAKIEIADNGRGIEEWVRDRVFLPHFSTKKTGSGLGLAIARQGIEQSGGKIWFETETGRGTTFMIEFPLAIG